MWRRWLGIKRSGILGMNGRNRHYIGRYNDRTLYPLVDNKLKTKELADSYGIPTPALLHTVSRQHEVNDWHHHVPAGQGFVIKPVKGSGGKGIVVIDHHDQQQFVKTSGTVLSLADLQRHISNTLSGLHSLGGTPDSAIIEQRVTAAEAVQAFAYEGLPDIRVIVCCGFPVMAMTRLPTHESDGKANLHQGAIGVGLDMASGRAISAVQHGALVDRHPDTALPLAQLSVPGWSDLLTFAATCFDMTGLGYLGVDLVIDEHRGPLLLELNARPGLAIQVANQTGLLPRLKAAEQRRREALRWSPRQRVELAQQLFAHSNNPSKPDDSSSSSLS
ncbi:alpha-L-glutamate ligase-like protein [Bacterioplanes sanyensis]|uniref:Alpha-L-glutamate ligase-like protein n=1 Tax=Bacterioplanes sanyensis TaxID=1249553 RepID=A0A222FJS6_9GAMM|nr:alpha-L-glutamate ligase-like protein [Bacterioplanes sanyensis]ASP39297.1 alpha-L-glutamate ligase-like protein [Bacterioplanes sanyensis]